MRVNLGSPRFTIRRHSSVVEHFLGKKEVESSILSVGSACGRINLDMNGRHHG